MPVGDTCAPHPLNPPLVVASDSCQPTCVRRRKLTRYNSGHVIYGSLSMQSIISFFRSFLPYYIYVGRRRRNLLLHGTKGTNKASQMYS